MTVSYKLLKSKGRVANDAKMRVVVDSYDTAEMDRMGQHIEKASSLTSADLTGALDALRTEMVDQLGSGYRVHLPGLGHPPLAVKGEVCEDPKTGHFRLRNPHVRTVKFRPEKELLKALHGIDFENATYRRTPYVAPKPAEVAAALDQLFSASAFICRGLWLIDWYKHLRLPVRFAMWARVVRKSWLKEKGSGCRCLVAAEV